ncbi:hypothetical protein Taro_009892 [Colocasia esculenta]|uniref:PB1 domain-containing protein n=1 Tax=Colocasia esculenta TaxID=4460 RepID=A0A843U6X3_COLES|nr:hypothetical protein [Colocasia esculenta]
MGKPIGKNKRHIDTKAGTAASKQVRAVEQPHPSPRSVDADTAMFVDMSRELKEEGNKLFQRRDFRGAVLKYEKAVNLLPRAHADVASLRSSLAACFMLMQPADYNRAIEQCNLALEVSPKCSKALLKRARCYEVLDRLDFAVRDVDVVVRLEPNNATALEMFETLRKGIESKGVSLDDIFAVPAPEPTVVKARNKSRKKKNHGTKDKAVVVEGAYDIKMETDKAVVKEESKDDVTLQNLKVKLVLGEDIRVTQLPPTCTILQLREVVRDRFPNTRAVLVKYKDEEGDLVTITTTEELRWAEESGDPLGSLRLYITEVNPDQDLLFPLLPEQTEKGSDVQNLSSNQIGVSEKGSNKSETEVASSCIEEWIVQFAQLFKNHVAFDADDYLDLHELGMKLYSEAMEDVVTSEDAQGIFDMAAEKFRELAALALFNLGNVHMSRARKRLLLSEDASREVVMEEVNAAYDWAQEEYRKAAKQYEQALKIKPDFYEAFLALALQKFEQAKLSWYYAVTSKMDLHNWASSEVIELFDNVEDNMEKGTQVWQEIEEQRLKDLSKPNKENMLLQKMGLMGLFREMSNDEAAEQASNMISQINLLWGTILYERSIVEFKLKLPTWEDCLIASVEKFKLAGASAADLAVMMKNHCSNETAQEGLGFKIEEIVQAWNEMHDAKRWACAVPSFRLEPLFRRRVPKLHHLLENISVFDAVWIPYTDSISWFEIFWSVSSGSVSSGTAIPDRVREFASPSTVGMRVLHVPSDDVTLRKRGRNRIGSEVPQINQPRPSDQAVEVDGTSVLVRSIDIPDPNIAYSAGNRQWGDRSR